MLNCWCITWPVGFKRLLTSVRVFQRSRFDLHTLRWVSNQSANILRSSKCQFEGNIRWDINTDPSVVYVRCNMNCRFLQEQLLFACSFACWYWAELRTLRENIDRRLAQRDVGVGRRRLMGRGWWGREQWASSQITLRSTRSAFLLHITGMRRITTWRSTTDSIYDGAPSLHKYAPFHTELKLWNKRAGVELMENQHPLVRPL